MPLDVIALTRRDAVVLAAVLGEERGGGRLLLRVVAEDGARFRFPAQQALARATVPGAAGAGGGAPEGELARLRARVPAFQAWLVLHSQLVARPPIELPDAARVARTAGLVEEPAELSLALGLDAAAPWFRRRGTLLTAVPLADALPELMRMRLREFARAGEDAVAAWWPGRAAGIPTPWGDVHDAADVLRRVLTDRARFVEPDYRPDPQAAAADALRALCDWALAGAGDDTVRGRDLARRIGLPDEPDIGLEELVGCGALPPDVVPAPARAGLARPPAAEVVAEARTAAARPIDAGLREDLTGDFSVAVDDPATREVDDAVSVRRVEDSDDVLVLVHIADAAARVPAGGALDADLRRRATSLYLPDGMVFLVPDDALLDAMTLQTGEVRAAVTGFFRIDAAGEVVASRFARTLVRLDRRVSYDETVSPECLGDGGGDGALLVRTAERLRAARLARGARVTRTSSLKVSVVDGTPRLDLRRQDTPGDLVVSEAMVLVNAAAGAALAAAGRPAVFRSQAAGLPEGREIPVPEDPLHDLRVRRTFRPVVTSADPRPHAGLGAAAYAQCTSPLRRYGDLLNQRQIVALIDAAESPYSVTDLDAALLAHLHERERTVRSAGDAWTMVWTARALAAAGTPAVDGVLSRRPRHGQGHVWVPELARELPLRVPRDWRAPPVGARRSWPIAAIHPWRGRIVLGAPGEQDSGSESSRIPCT